MSAGNDEARSENFSQIWRSYAIDEKLRDLASVATFPPRMRDDLLRDYRTRRVHDKDEIRLRSALDELLHACGVMEIGFRAGVLRDFESHCQIKLAPLLLLPEVRVYYEVYYPLSLPVQFLSRLRENDLPIDGAFKPAWFANLLSLDANFRDRRLERFLRVVDGFRLGSFNFSSLKIAVQDSDTIVEAITTPRELRTKAQEIIAGLERFLFFCVDLQSLLDSAIEDRSLQDAAFQLYSYWFKVRQKDLAEIVDATLSALSGAADFAPEQALPERTALMHLFARASTSYYYPPLSR